MPSQDDVVKLLVGKVNYDAEGRKAFSGFWAEFHGQKLTSHEDEHGVVYTLYRCTNYRYPTFRVYRVNESSAEEPEYELFPYDERGRGAHMMRGVAIPGYEEAYKEEDLVAAYPVFTNFLNTLEDVEMRRIRSTFIDP